MPAAAPLPLVAVINNSEEVVEFLRLALEASGYRHVTETVLTFKRGQQELQQFLATHAPQAVIWDIAFPYAENWALFCRVRDSGVLAGCGVVLTTANKRALEEWVGPTSTLELVGKPYDVEDILGALARALTGIGLAPPADPADQRED